MWEVSSPPFFCCIYTGACNAVWRKVNEAQLCLTEGLSDLLVINAHMYTLHTIHEYKMYTYTTTIYITCTHNT